MVNKKRLIKLTQRLIQINSENPPGREYRIACFIKNYLQKMGIRPRIYEFKKGRSNIIATLKGKDRKHSLLLTPHLDTVPAGGNWHFKPFLGAIDKNKIYGLGATDCKGNLACALEAINSLVEDKVLLNYSLIFAATADEESGSVLGLIPLLDKGILRPSLAVVLDSDDFDVIVAQKGLIHFRVKIKGKKAHGAYPSLGINAIDIAVKIIADLKHHQWPFIKNKYLKVPTLNIGTIKGGDKVNVVADWCEVEFDLRFLPGTSGQKILKEVKKIINKHTKQSAIEIESMQKPYLIKKEHPLVRSLISAVRKIKITPRIKGCEGATTITFFQHKRIPAVAFGFGSSGCAHIADEYVKIDNLYKGAQVLEEFLKDYNFT